MSWQVKLVQTGKELSWPEHNEHIAIAAGGKIIMPSSGSTGEPKAIVLDADRLWLSASAFLKFHQLENQQMRFWNYLPMSYLGGLFNLSLIPLAAGGSIYIDDIFNGKTFLTFWQLLNDLKLNTLWLVPTILRGL